MKTETCKLYSRVFWVFLSNITKIDPHNFELCSFNLGRFLRPSVDVYGELLVQLQMVCVKVLECDTDDVSAHPALSHDCRDNQSAAASGSPPAVAERSRQGDSAGMNWSPHMMDVRLEIIVVHAVLLSITAVVFFTRSITAWFLTFGSQLTNPNHICWPCIGPLLCAWP